MPKTLVIVESPTKAKTIAKFLGAAYIVESSFGHVRDLPKSKMGVDIEGGTFEPSYTVSTDKRDRVKKLKELARTCEGQVIFATDEDREGEAIAWHLAELLKIDPATAKRIVFHEITKTAIQDALKHPRTINQELVNAQVARRVLDRLVGYELSPFLWKKVTRGLSAGRVQSVAVRLIVEREREIQAFDPQEYWTITGQFIPSQQQIPQPITAKLYAKEGKKLDKFDLGTEADAQSVLQALETAAYTISSIEQKETKRTPPPPFRTSTLQQKANQSFGYSSRQTMRIAQQLYEGINLGQAGTQGLITYMRTDSTNLSEKFLQEAAAHVRDTYGDQYALQKARQYSKKTKGAQEAHEAIRPTDPTRTPESIAPFLDSQQLKLYTLIWKRAVATQMTEARLNKTNLDITADPYTFRASGQTLLFPGWLALYPESTKEELLPELAQGTAMQCTELVPEQHFTKPPARYSDATLVKVLEENGIGRPSTYAPTIGTIESRGYVERDDNKRLRPLDIAFVVNDLLVEHFANIVDYSFTAKMEANLDEIAEGTQTWQPIIAEFYHPFHKNLEEKTDALDREDVLHMRELGTDPESGKPIYVRIGRYGPFVQKGSKEDEDKPTFASLKAGQLMDTITLEEALELLSLPKKLGTMPDGTELTVAIGRFGPYIKAGKEFHSLKPPHDPYTVDLQTAIHVVTEGREEKAKKTINIFEDGDTTIKVLRGPYGPYITDGKKNARIPKDIEDPSTLDIAACKKLLKEAKPGRKRATKKKKTTKKTK
jgi:DNA topoisomerase-1